jgi:hypothetical protein
MVKLGKTSILIKISRRINLRSHHWMIFALTFIVFAGIRGIAEIQAGELPAGWDPLNYYAPWTVAYMNQGIFNQHFIGAPPLVFILTILMTSLTQNVFLAIKILAPILYGVLGLSVLYFTSSYLSWGKKKGIMCALLLMSQTAALRLSWDLFKNQLAISLLFFQFPLIFSVSKNGGRKVKLAIIVLSLLIVLAHQFVAVVYFVILLSIILSKRKSTSFKKFLLFANLPALIIFFSVFVIYSGGTNASLVSYPNVGTIDFFKVVQYVDAPTFSVFKDYISLYGSYSNLLAESLTLFVLLYAPLLPLIIFGFWNDEFLTPFLVLNLIGAFMPLVSPTFALLDFMRWMWMLIYPFSIYATNALFKLIKYSKHHEVFCSKFKKKINLISREKVAATVYLLILIVFAFLYIVGDVRLTYTPIEGYVPTSLSDKPISNEAMHNIVSGIQWLNELHQSKSTIDFLDEFESFNSSLWSQEGNFTIRDSILTLNTTTGSGVSYFYHNFDTNYLGTIELKVKFHGFTLNSYIVDLLSVHKTSGYGGGVIYYYNASSSNVLSYWDSETNTPYQLMQLDENWHTIKIICNSTGRTINIDGFDKLSVNTGRSFGELLLGIKESAIGYGGAFSVDSISVKGNLSACLITSYREIGPVWIYVDKQIEIVVFVKDLDKALNFAVGKTYSAIYILLPTSSYGNFTAVYQAPSYSLYAWGN